MNTKDIKIGETYLLPVTVTTIEKSKWIEVTTCNDYKYGLAPSEVKTLLQNSTKNTETAPKYAPNRLFKKGDKVRIIMNNGRHYGPDAERMYLCKGIVIFDETLYENISVRVNFGNSEEYIEIDQAYLELVNPVEELEPYKVKLLQDGISPDTYHYWAVMDNMGYEVARFWCEQYEKGKAKEAAEAERDRLNAEYRKDRENG